MKIKSTISFALLALALPALVIAAPLSVARAYELPTSSSSAIIAKCDNIKENLVTLQHNDSRTRVYLGREYEEIIANYLTPLNVALVENRLSSATFIDNQNNFVSTRDNFVIDYIEYQKTLEELVNMDCHHDPSRFYDKLTTARTKRRVVAEDVAKLRSLTKENIALVTNLMEEL